MLAEFAAFKGDPDFAVTLARGLAVIECFAAREKGLSVSHISGHIGISRAAVRRILITLQYLGYAESDGRLYRLKTRVLRLGVAYLSSATLPILAQPLLERITATVMGRVLIASLPQEEFEKYLARIELKSLTPKTVSDKSKFLEIIEKVRVSGYSLIDQELELGLRSIAVPVKTLSGRVVAAMNIGLNAHRFPASKMVSSFLPVLRENASILGKFLT